MQTGEYRGFVGQFSVWLRGQIAIWRVPLLLSLGLHALLFWPDPLQESRFGASAMRSRDVVQARLRPALPMLPEVPHVPDVLAKPPAPVRHASVMEPPSRPRRSRPDAPPEQPPPFEPSALSLTPTVGLDAAAVRSYRIGWARALANSGLRGRLGADMHGGLEIGVALAASGQVRAIALLRSSGIAALDQAVVAEMRNAVPAVPLPPAMLGRELVIALPVEVGAAPPISAADR